MNGWQVLFNINREYLKKDSKYSVHEYYEILMSERKKKGEWGGLKRIL